MALLDLFALLRALTLLMPFDVAFQAPAGVPPATTTQPAITPKLKVEIPPKKEPETDAEKIANAQDSIKSATIAIEKMQKRLEDPDGEYQKADSDFRMLNVQLKEAEVKIAKLRRDGMEAEAKKLEATLPALQADWQLAKERFDIAIRQRKASVNAINVLKERIASDQQLLKRLSGDKETPAANPMTPTTPVSPPPPTPKKTETTEAKTQPAPTAPALTSGISIPGIPGVPASAAATAQPAPTSSAPPAAAAAPAPDDNDPVIRQARAELEARRATLREAESRLHMAQERVHLAEQSIKTANTMLELDQESAAQAEKSATRLSEILRTKPPADAANREAMTQKLLEAQNRLSDSRARAKRLADHLIEMNSNLQEIKGERDTIAKEVEAKQQRVHEAEAALSSAQNPIAPRKIVQWIKNKGPRLLLVILCMTIVHVCVRQFSRHIVRFITRHNERGSTDDRENRANTLVGVFRYVAGIVVFGGGFVMLLDEAGVPIVPLMGGAAVLGLAVAFGAQNLIRDYFTGFMMLMEDQYSVNDVVRIGTISGAVELITLRITVLRDTEGVRHFIPHSTITSVSNLTHGWSRAVLDIGVAYKENIDRVIEVLMQLGREMRLDPVLGKHILENPEMLGVVSLADSSVGIRFLLKTRPLKQWPIKRELLRRIKNRFDELGIEIPFPQRTIYHHFPDGTNSNALFASSDDRSAA